MIWLTLGVIAVVVVGLLVYAAYDDAPPSDRPTWLP